MGEIPHPFLKGNVMHELSIVTYVIEQVEKIAKENELTDDVLDTKRILLIPGM